MILTHSFFGSMLGNGCISTSTESIARRAWHERVGSWGYWLIGLHALAGLYHHYVVRDNTLLRMLPYK